MSRIIGNFPVYTNEYGNNYEGQSPNTITTAFNSIAAATTELIFNSNAQTISYLLKCIFSTDTLGNYQILWGGQSIALQVQVLTPVFIDLMPFGQRGFGPNLFQIRNDNAGAAIVSCTVWYTAFVYAG